MRRTLALLAALALSPAALAQNLLRWDAWTIDSNNPRPQISAGQNGITFVPIGQGRVGFSQTITTTSPMLVQLHVRGRDCYGPSKYRSRWVIDRQGLWTASGIDCQYQAGIPFALPAGTHRVGFSCDGCPTSNCMPFLLMSQPILRPVSSPAIRVDARSDLGLGYTARIESDAHILIAGVRRTSSPIRVPGFANGVEIDLSAPHAIVASSAMPTVTFSWNGMSGPPGGIFFQAVGLGNSQAFGSRVYVKALPW